MSIKELKEFFTITIDDHKFVPQVYDKGDQYIHLEYLDDNFMLSFAVTKSSYMKAAKRTIFEDIYSELKSKGVL